MKGGLIAVIVIIALLSLTAVHTVYVVSMTNELIEKVDRAGLEDDADMKAAFADFKKREWFLSLTLSDEHLHQVEVTFNECLSLISMGESSDAKIAKNRLMLELEQIKRFSGFNIKSIF